MTLKWDKASTIEMHDFNHQLWEALSFQINFSMKTIMLSAANETLELRGTNVFIKLSM